MILRKNNTKTPTSDPKGSKWQELANLLSRKSRSFSLLKDSQDPFLKKVHEQRDKIFSKLISNENNQ